MDRSEAKAIVEEVLPKLRWALQLQAWTVNVTWGHINERDSVGSENVTVGRCFADTRYMRASVELDNEMIDSRKELVFALRHELLHVMHAGFQLHRCQANCFLNSETRDALRMAWDDGCEMTVKAMENMIDDGLGLDAEKMMVLSKAHEEGKEEVKP